MYNDTLSESGWPAIGGYVKKIFLVEIAAMRIFNKVGAAYGFLTVVAYIADFDKKVEFLVIATIYCNRDGILNETGMNTTALDSCGEKVAA